MHTHSHSPSLSLPLSLSLTHSLSLSLSLPSLSPKHVGTGINSRMHFSFCACLFVCDGTCRWRGAYANAEEGVACPSTITTLKEAMAYCRFIVNEGRTKEYDSCGAVFVPFAVSLGDYYQEAQERRHCSASAHARSILDNEHLLEDMVLRLASPFLRQAFLLFACCLRLKVHHHHHHHNHHHHHHDG